MGNLTFLKLTIVCLISSTVPSTTALTSAVRSARAVGLLPRQNAVCGGDANLKQCGGNFPSNFCCGNGNTCMAIGSSNDSVLCCPTGNDCKTIMPISCNTDLFDATVHPDNPFHGPKPANPLATCGVNRCCPGGYTCKDSICILDSTVSTATRAQTSAAASLSSATGIRTTTTPTTIPTTAGSSPANTSPADVSASCSPFPVTAILVGFFPGLIAGCLLAAGLILCCGRRNKEEKRSDSSLGSVTAKVSDPIYHDTGATRTDFLRHASKSRKSPSTMGSSVSPSSSPALSRVRSLFHRTPTQSSRKWDRTSQQPFQTPPGQLKREPSMESITIYSPPDPRMADRTTTYEDVMKAAGAQSNHLPPFMGSPGMVDPRSRGVDGMNLR